MPLRLPLLLRSCLSHLTPCPPHLTDTTRLLRFHELCLWVHRTSHRLPGLGKNIALDIARGLAFLHSQHIVHLDLKSPNGVDALPSQTIRSVLCEFSPWEVGDPRSPSCRCADDRGSSSPTVCHELATACVPVHLSCVSAHRTIGRKCTGEIRQRQMITHF